MVVRSALLLAAVAGAVTAPEPFNGVSVGIAGRDFVVVGADATFRRGDLAFRNMERTGVAHVAPACVLACVGHRADAARFAEYVKQNLLAYAFLAGAAPTGAAAAHFVRRELAERRRGGAGMPQLRVLLGAVDGGGPAKLFWIDETGASTRLPYAAHGAGQALVLGHLDEAYDPDLSRADAVALVGDCLDLLRRRSALAVDSATIAVLDGGGCETRDWDPPAAPLARKKKGPRPPAA